MYRNLFANECTQDATQDVLNTWSCIGRWRIWKCASSLDIYISWLLIVRRDSNVSKQLNNSREVRISRHDARMPNAPVIDTTSRVKTYTWSSCTYATSGKAKVGNITTTSNVYVVFGYRVWLAWRIAGEFGHHCSENGRNRTRTCIRDRSRASAFVRDGWLIIGRVACRPVSNSALRRMTVSRDRYRLGRTGCATSSIFKRELTQSRHHPDGSLHDRRTSGGYRQWIFDIIGIWLIYDRTINTGYVRCDFNWLVYMCRRSCNEILLTFRRGPPIDDQKLSLRNIYYRGKKSVHITEFRSWWTKLSVFRGPDENLVMGIEKFL